MRRRRWRRRRDERLVGGRPGGHGGHPITCTSWDELFAWEAPLTLRKSPGSAASVVQAVSAPDGGALVLVAVEAEPGGTAVVDLAGLSVQMPVGAPGGSGGVVARLGPTGAAEWSSVVWADASATTRGAAPAGIATAPTGSAVVAGSFDAPTVDVGDATLSAPGSGTGVFVGSFDGSGTGWVTAFQGSGAGDAAEARSIGVSSLGQTWVGIDVVGSIELGGPGVLPAPGGLVELGASGALDGSVPFPPGAVGGPRSISPPSGAELRVVSGYTASFDLGGFTVLKDPFLEDQVFLAVFDASGAPLDARPMRNPSDISGDLHLPRAVTPSFVVADAVEAPGTIRGSFAARLEGAASDWSFEVGPVLSAVGAAEPLHAELVVFGTAHPDVCGVAAAHAALAMVDAQGVEVWRSAVIPAGATDATLPRSVDSTPGRELVLAFSDRVVKTRPLP